MSDVIVTTDPPAANTPEARTPDGTLKDVSPTPINTPSTTEPKTDGQTDSGDGSTFLTGKRAEPANKEGETKPESKAEGETKPEPQTGAPDKYSDFKLPDGYEFDPAARTSFETWAKKAGLSQELAQGAIDIWSDHAAKTAQAPYDLWANTQKDWHNQILDRFGGEEGANRMSADLNKAINNVLPPSLQKSFRSAMDFTGAGSNPDILEAMTILLKPHMEAKPIPRGNPSAEGQRDPGTPKGPVDIAAAMYPQLVKNRPQ